MKGRPQTFPREHEARVVRHIERVQTLSALLQTHEQLDVAEQDFEYMRTLRTRINKVKAQLRNMGCDLFVTP